ncbi:hypothetical protein GQ53DRAFT_755354 [Thozetella sp. PMI_491]|nr:hypothetical protein GQ53DRAFT_755354 [Thozetella sp. PMI_491]
MSSPLCLLTPLFICLSSCRPEVPLGRYEPTQTLYDAPFVDNKAVHMREPFASRSILHYWQR